MSRERILSYLKTVGPSRSRRVADDLDLCPRYVAAAMMDMGRMGTARKLPGTYLYEYVRDPIRAAKPAGWKEVTERRVRAKSSAETRAIKSAAVAPAKKKTPTGARPDTEAWMAAHPEGVQRIAPGVLSRPIERFTPAERKRLFGMVS